MFSEYICDCGDNHLDNPFCYMRHLKYNRKINGDNSIIEAATLEKIISLEDADSMRVSVVLFQSGYLPLHRRIFNVYFERLNQLIEALRAIGYAL